MCSEREYNCPAIEAMDHEEVIDEGTFWEVVPCDEPIERWDEWKTNTL